MVSAAQVTVLKDTTDIRMKLLDIWKLVDEKKITLAEARVHISLARAVLDTLKVEIAAAHLNQQQFPTVPVIGRTEALPLRRAQQ
jgi:hypothetical protein